MAAHSAAYLAECWVALTAAMWVAEKDASMVVKTAVGRVVCWAASTAVM